MIMASLITRQLVKAASIDTMTTIYLSPIVGKGIERKIRRKVVAANIMNLMKVYCR